MSGEQSFKRANNDSIIVYIKCLFYHINNYYNIYIYELSRQIFKI